MIKHTVKCWVALDGKKNNELVRVGLDRGLIEFSLPKFDGEYDWRFVEADVTYVVPKLDPETFDVILKRPTVHGRPEIKRRPKSLEIVQKEADKGCITARDFIARMCNGVSWSGQWSVEWLSQGQRYAILKKSAGTVWAGIGRTPNYVPTQRILVPLQEMINPNGIMMCGTTLHGQAIYKHEGRITKSMLADWKCCALEKETERALKGCEKLARNSLRK